MNTLYTISLYLSYHFTFAGVPCARLAPPDNGHKHHWHSVLHHVVVGISVISLITTHILTYARTHARMHTHTHTHTRTHAHTHTRT